MEKKHYRNKRRRFKDEYVPQGDPAALATPVERLGLRENTLAALQAGGVKTAGDLACRFARDMYKVQNIGKRNIFEMEKALAALGLAFRREEKPEEEKEQKDAPRAKGEEGRKQSGRQEKQQAKAQPGGGREQDRRGEKERAQNRGENRENAGRGGKKAQEMLNRELSRLYAGMTINEIIMGGKKRRPAFVPYPKEGIKQGDLLKFYRAGKWGYKDWKGNVVIQPQYDEAFPFREDRAGVEEGGLIGYIDKENNKVIECKYDCGTSFSEGLAAVSVGEKSGYIDLDGNAVTEMIFDVATPFSGGKAVVRENERWGVLDRQTLKVLWR